MEIYETFEDEDRFVLSNGHAASALYVALEHYRGVDSNVLFREMGDHPKRDFSLGVHCSTGSLGMGITVAIGMAMASPSSKVSCVISDGECAEGSVWESLKFLSRREIINLTLYVNANGWTAYDPVNSESLERQLRSFSPTIEIRRTSTYPLDEFGLSAHYLTLNDFDYEKLREKICAQNL
jgi:transketolase